MIPNGVKTKLDDMIVDGLSGIHETSKTRPTRQLAKVPTSTTSLPFMHPVNNGQRKCQAVIKAIIFSTYGFLIWTTIDRGGLIWTGCRLSSI